MDTPRKDVTFSKVQYRLLEGDVNNMLFIVMGKNISEQKQTTDVFPVSRNSYSRLYSVCIVLFCVHGNLYNS